jgi:hypothetical protein
MKKLTPTRLLLATLAIGFTAWTGQLATQAQTTTTTPGQASGNTSGGNNSTPTRNVNNTGGVANGTGNATSGSSTSSTSGGNPTGGETSSGATSSGSTTHVNTQTGLTPGDGNSGVTHTPPSGVSPGTGASPNPH